MSSKKKEALPLQLAISDPYTGVAFKVEITDEKTKMWFWGKKLGEKIEGDAFGFPGWVFEITGGTDDAGFPHVPFIEGPQWQRVLLSGPPGYWPRKYRVPKKTGGYRIINLKNVKKKKGVRGNTLCERTRQVNLKIVERKGRPLKDLPEEAILSDPVGREIVTKLGKAMCKWGLDKLVVEQEGSKSPLRELLGLSDEVIDKLYKKVGILFLKEAPRELIFELRSRGRKHAPPLARHIAATFWELYQKIQKGEIDASNADAVVNFVVSKLKEGLDKVKAGKIKELSRVPFKIVLKAEGGEAGS